MAKQPTLIRRFEELTAQIEPIEASKKHVRDNYFDGYRIDENSLLSWQVKVRNLLSAACGKDSEHFKEFLKQQEPQSYRSGYEKFKDLCSVFFAAKEDYEGGYITSFRSLVQSELFDNELEQSEELLSNGYLTAAAVIAGVVLETSLRQLCMDRGLSTGKLDKMNADLARSGCFNLLMQKRITALADIRNNAAHGHAEKFTNSDVDDMIKQVRRFVADHL